MAEVEICGLEMEDLLADGQADGGDGKVCREAWAGWGDRMYS